MSAQEKKLSKKRGRPATGQGELVGVRVQPDLMGAIDAWIAERARDFGDDLSRPEAIRRLTAEALIAMGLLKP